MAIDVPLVNASPTAASGNPHTITVAAPGIAAGNVALVVGMVAGGRTLTGVTDSRSNTWTVDETLANTTNHGGGIASSVLGTTLQAGDTITVTFSSTGVFAGHLLDLGDGLDTASLVNISVSQANASSATLDSSTGATSDTADQLQIGVGFHAGTPTLTPETLSPVWNHLASATSPTTTRTNRVHYRIVSGTEAQRFNGTLGTAQVNTGFFVTYRGASGASTTANAEVATATVAVNDPGKSIAVPGGNATATVVVNQPNAYGGTTAPAGVAEATVVVNDADTSIAATPAAAAATVTVNQPAAGVTVPAGNASATVTVNQPTISTVTPSGFLIGSQDNATDYLEFVKTGTLKIKATSDRRNGTMDVTLTGLPNDFDYGLIDESEQVAAENIIIYQRGGEVPFCGVLRQVTPRDIGAEPGHIDVALGCQDWTFLAADHVVDPTVASGVRTTIESDATRIAWLFNTFAPDPVFAGYVDIDTATDVDTVLASMPAQDFTGMNLAEALDAICKLSGATWYIEASASFGSAGSGITPAPHLHYFEAVPSRTLTTPFGVAATDTFTSTGHGMSAGQAIAFQTLTGGTGLVIGTTYYVIASGLTADAFKVSATLGGSAFDFTSDISAGTFDLVVAAPFILSDEPDGQTAIGYTDLAVASESTEYRTRVVVVGGNGYQEAFGSGDRTGFIKDTSITETTAGAEAAAVYLATNALQVNGRVNLRQSGLEPGMHVAIKSANQLTTLYGSDTHTFRVTTVETLYRLVDDVSYSVTFGTIPRPLEHAIKAIGGDAGSIAADVVAGVLKGYIGEIVGWPLATPPTGFILCDGSSLLRAGTYAGLFAVIGTTFGTADGTHFNVPDLRGRFPLGVDGTHALASTGGAIDHTHTGPSHTHTGPSHTHTGPSHTHDLSSDGWARITPDTAGEVHTELVTGIASWTSNRARSWATPDGEVAAAKTEGAMLDGATDAGGTGATGSGGTGATGSGGTGATSADGDDTTGAAGTGATGASGTGATGAEGTGASGTGNPPYLAIHYVIRYA